MQATTLPPILDPPAGHVDDVPTLTRVHDEPSAGRDETGRSAPALAGPPLSGNSPFAAEDLPDPIDQSMVLARHPLAEMAVLIVDRSRASRLELRDLVTDLGAAQVIEADGVEPAMLTLRLQPVHLIVSEYLLDKGVTAQVLMERLRQADLLPLSTVFVVISAERSARSVASVAEWNPDAYVIKPLVRHDVRMRLARASHRKRVLYELHGLLEAGRLPEAADEALRLADAHPPLRSEALRLTSGRLLSAGMADLADRLVRAALARERYPWAQFRLAELRCAASRYDDAERLLEGLVRRHPDHLPAYELLARIREMHGRYDAALECLDQVSGRAGHTVERLRRTGALALRVGDLPRAESSYNAVMRRTGGDAPGSVEDSVNLAQVLVARGKHEQAERVTRAQAQRNGGHVDARVAEALLAFTKARQAGDRNRMVDAMDAVVLALEDGAVEVSMPLGLQVLQACSDESLRSQGYRAALALVRSRRADRPTLNRLRALVEKLSHTPAHLLDPADIPLSLERLASEGWDHHLGPVIHESIEHWQRMTPADNRLRGWHERLAALARRFGILQYG